MMVKEYGLDINSRNDKGSTALHWAAYNSSYLTMNYLIALGADVNKVDCRGVSVLHLAVQASEEEENARAIRLLVRHGADVLI